jgi:hypothetical protein
MYSCNIGVNTPFFKSQVYNGFPLTHCLPIKKSEFNEIAKHGDDSEIIFHINLTSLRIKEKRKITVGEVKQLLVKGAAKQHKFSIGEVININRIHCKLI